jgi:tetratricopeptide (TPR) repeat protein
VLTKEEKQQLAKRYTESPAAYEAYLKGLYFWNQRTIVGMRKAIEYFQEAIDKDPNFALGYVGLADAYLIDNPPRAQSPLRKALELDDTLGEAHASSGFNSLFWRWAWNDAEREFKLAIGLAPNYPTAHQWYANYLAVTGQLDEAKAEMRQALELDPLSPNMHADLGQIHYFAHEYDQAIAECRKALEIDANFFFAHKYLFAAYLQKGLYSEAVEEYLKAGIAGGLTPATIAALRRAYAESGWPGFLHAKLQFEKQDNQRSPAQTAIIYTKLGDKARAIELLERAYDESDFFLTFIKVEPMYDDLRAEPRFQDLLRRMKLTP